MSADPPQMSLAEKLACEWEARHDVAARGRIADFAPVQHYLSHARCEEGLSPSGGGGHRPARSATPAANDSGISPAVRSWLRWGEEGGGEAPLFPRL